MKTFRDIIVKEVERRGWSGYRLAQEAGLPMRAVQNYLSGKCDILAERYAALCRVLGFEVRPIADAAKERISGPLASAKRPGRRSVRSKTKQRKTGV